jgi:pimeloyl-ACP methyl ester carboxylesterase
MTIAAATPTIREQTFDVWGGALTMHVKVAGTGPPLLYLHQATGLVWDRFLAHFADRYTVYAPELPGTSDGDPHAVHAVDELFELVLIYEEVIRRLGLIRPIVVGQSFGGMLAAELAACFPASVGKLVLLDPMGLWQDDAPVGDWMTATASTLPALLFHDPAGDAAQEVLRPPTEAAAAQAWIADRVWATGCAGKFLWPIPDRGLRNRLHRITASTLIVWGRQDRLVPVRYASEFAELIADSKVAVIDECGHLPQIEQFTQTADIVVDFLGAE